VYKIAGKVIDFTDDAKLASDPEYRALVDEHVHFSRHSELPDSDFALVLNGLERHGKFPIYNKVATALSLKWFDKHAEEIHPFFRAVASHFLEKAAAEYGLAVPETIREFAVQGVTDNRLDLRQMADDSLVESMDKTSRLERMERFWLNNEREMTLEERNTKADKVASCAAELTVPVHPRIWEYVTKTAIGPKFRAAVEQRIKTAVQLENQDAADEFKAAFEGVKGAKEAAQILRTLDIKHELLKYYPRMTDPFQAAYGGTQQVKHATDTGLRYKLETLAAQHDHELSSVLSREGLDQFRKDPVGTYQSLPPLVQQYIMAKFDHEMEEQKDALVNNHESKAKLKKRVSNLRAGKREYEGVYEIEDKEKSPKMPTSTYMDIGKAQKISPAADTPAGTGSMSTGNRG